MDDQNKRLVLVLKNQDTGTLEEFEAVNGEIHVPPGNYALKAPLPLGDIYVDSPLVVNQCR